MMVVDSISRDVKFQTNVPKNKLTLQPEMIVERRITTFFPYLSSQALLQNHSSLDGILKILSRNPPHACRVYSDQNYCSLIIVDMRVTVQEKMVEYNPM